MLKRVPVANDAFELRDEFDKPVVTLTSVTGDDGALRVTATVTRNLANDIIAGLRLLDVLRSSVQSDAFGYAPTPPVAPAPWSTK